MNKRILIAFCLLPFALLGQNVAYQNIERYRPASGTGINIVFRFQKFGAPFNVSALAMKFEIKDLAGASRVLLTRTSGVTQTDSATITNYLTYAQVNSLVREQYYYHLYYEVSGVKFDVCAGNIRFIRGVSPSATLPVAILIKLDSGTSSTTSVGVGSGGSSGGITSESDPSVPSFVKSISQIRLAAWDLAATQGGGSGFNSTLSYIQIGSGASGAATYESVVLGKNASYTATWKSGTVIGWGASNNQQGGVSIGEGANGTWSNVYGCADGSDNTNVGRWSRAYGWRTTALGAFAHAGGQSSTSIGAGSAALSSHSIALGRGAYAGTDASCQNALVTQATTLYLSNGWAHRFPSLPTSEMETEYSIEAMVPAMRPVRVQGVDAFDARVSPSDFNVAGGTIRIAAGRGTGTGQSGRVEIMTAPVQNQGQNVKNEDVVAGAFDGTNVVNGTYFLLFDPSTGILKRVKMMTADGSGRRILYIDN